MPADQSLLTALGALQSALDESAVPSMIIGGIAVISHGVARDTSDIDATVWGNAIRPEELLAVLRKHGINPRIENALEFAHRHQILLVENFSTILSASSFSSK